MKDFIYQGLPSKVVFGVGTLSQLAEEVRALDCQRALVLSTPQQAEQAQAVLTELGDLGAGLYDGARMHTPVETTDDAADVMRQRGADCTVALGGGSTIGLGKALSLRFGTPQVAIPTTYAGSEMTPILGETKEGLKTTQRTLKVLPETVIYDVSLTLSLPVGMSGTSGLNAIAHAVEALYAKDQNPIISMLAEQGIAALGRSLPVLQHQARDLDARSDALYGAWLCGICLGSVGMSLHHKLCHTLGGSFDLPHAETHSIVLPHAMAYNSPAVPVAERRIATALNARSAAGGLFDLAQSLSIPDGLKALGMVESDIDTATDIALNNPYWNPQPIERDGIRALIARAWQGSAPKVE